MGKKTSDWGLKYAPGDVDAALDILEAYLLERVALVDSPKITDPQSAVKMMAAIQDFIEKVKARAKTPAEHLYDKIRFTIVPTIFDETDTVNTAVDGVGKCRLQDDITCRVVDKEELFKWLTNNELEDIIQQQVNAQTLAAQMRARIKENAEIVGKALKAGKSDPAQLAKLQKPMPPATVVEIKPIVRAQLTRE